MQTSPIGQVSTPQPPFGQLTSQAHDVPQEIGPSHALFAHVTSQGPGPHVIESQAPPMLQSMAHDDPAEQSMPEHAEFFEHRIVHAKPLGHMTFRHEPGVLHSTSQVSATRSQLVQRLPKPTNGHSGASGGASSGSGTQKPWSQVRSGLHSEESEHVKSDDFL